MKRNNEQLKLRVVHERHSERWILSERLEPGRRDWGSKPTCYLGRGNNGKRLQIVAFLSVYDASLSSTLATGAA